MKSKYFECYSVQTVKFASEVISSDKLRAVSKFRASIFLRIESAELKMFFP